MNTDRVYRSVDEAQGHQHGSLSGPALSIISSNIDGLRLAELCIRNICDILCLQETQRGPSRNRPRIPGMTLITERLHDRTAVLFSCVMDKQWIIPSCPRMTTSTSYLSKLYWLLKLYF